MTSDVEDTETPQIVYLAFVNGKWPENPTKLLGVYGDEADAEAIAKDVGEDWYNWYVKEHDVQTDPVTGKTQSL